MKTTIFTFIIFLFFGCSCSHNSAFLAKGKILKNPLFTYVDGIAAFGELRENSTLKIDSKDEDELSTDSTAKLPNEFSAELKISRQATGYLKELADVSESAAIEFIKSFESEEKSTE